MKNILNLLLLISGLSYSQKLRITYSAKCRSNLSIEKTNPQIMVLDFVDNKSIFREMIDRDGDSLKINNGSPMNSNGFENQYYIKKNLAKGRTEKIITNSENYFLLPIDEKLNWQILSDKKKIAGYNVQKAIANYGGREWSAWFTSEIPISDGPYVFCGLPGLIVSIEDKNTEYVFNLIETKKNRGELFDARKQLIAIDWNQFEQLATNYYDNPNREMEQKIKSNKVFVTDAKGNRIDLNIKQMNADLQDYIRKNNNPIELNHKINYQ
ncbi:MAG: hypothetical protein DI529_01285 [Chryseobacterium sp.]|nr:MAG: hypothetical protein DI529_01285 [Chryseobacterium sp.]